jgi:beta-glucanase (GH16 family)
MQQLPLLLLSLCALFVSCGSSGNGDEPTPTDRTISITPATAEADALAGSAEFTVSVDADWSVSTTADWCSVFPGGGVKNQPQVVTVKYTANTGMEDRVASLVVKSGSSSKSFTLTQHPSAAVQLSGKSFTVGGQAQSVNVTITSNTAWSITSSADWCAATPASGASGETTVAVAVKENTTSATRAATLKVAYQGGEQEITVSQLSDVVAAPEGYSLVWSDEFNDASLTMPDESKWWYETAAPGWVNNELQRYVAGKLGDNVTAEVSNGMLKIHAMKVDNEVISARVNTRESWTYGYFEARLKLPKGKGTWPAFWMMPQESGTWPACGEIDIMEEVGYNPNYTSSSIHCGAYNHVMGTQKTKEQYTAGAQDEFHVYALEWTEDFIKTYVDGKLFFTFTNDKKGDTNTWPFNKAFYLKLNLAWGGDWGGAQGVDESALPTTYEIDYVRVFKKD